MSPLHVAGFQVQVEAEAEINAKANREMVLNTTAKSRGSMKCSSV